MYKHTVVNYLQRNRITYINQNNKLVITFKPDIVCLNC